MARIFLKWLGRILGVVLVLLLAAFALLQTGLAKRTIAELAESALTDDSTRAEVTGLHGFLPFDVQLDRFALADGDTPWLALEDVRFDWSLAALFLVRLQIDEISVARVVVDHLPPAKPEPEEEEPTEPFAIPTSLPELPGFVPAVVIEKLAIEQIMLGATVVGEPMSLALHGQVRSIDDRSALSLKLDVKRLDQATLNAAVAATLGYYPLALELKLTAEDSGGLLGRLAGRPHMTPVELTLSGQGPLTGWQGALTADAATIARLDSSLAFGITEQPYLDWTGKLFPASDLLPVDADTVEVLGKRTDIDLKIKAPAPRTIEIATLTVRNALLDLGSQARVDLDGQSITADLKLLIDRLQRLDPLAGVALNGVARLDLEIDGALQQPGIAVKLDSSGLAIDRFSIEQVTNVITVKLLRPLTEGFDGEISGNGRLQGMVQGETPLPEHTLDWTLRAHAPAQGTIDLSGFDVTGEQTRLSLTAAVDPQQLLGEGRLELAIDQLNALAPESGVRGEAALNADFTMQKGAERIAINVAGGLDKLAGLPDGIDQLLGRRLDLSLVADIAPKGASRISDLSVKTKGLDLSGELNANMTTTALAGQLRLDVPRLEPLAATIGQPLAGSLKLDTTIAGSTEAPSIELKTLLRRFRLTDLSFETITLDATAKDVIRAPTGGVRLVARQPRQNIRAGVDYSLEGSRLKLAGLEIKAPATDFGGRFDIDLDKPLIDGTLKGGISDLKRLREWLPLTLAGTVRLDSVLQSRNGRQSVALDLKAQDIDGDFGALKTATVDADLSDLFGDASIRVSADAAGFAQGDIRLDAASVKATGHLSDLSLDASASGHAIDDFSVKTRARFGQTPKLLRVALTQLEGRFGEAPLRLEQPTRFQMQGKKMVLEPLALTFGEARLDAEAAYGPRQVNGRLQARVPLAMAKTFGIADLEGALKTDLALGGTPAAPEVDVAVDLNGFRMNEEALAKVPETGMTLRARLARRQLVADLRADNALLEQPVSAHADLPVSLSLEPFRFDLPTNKPLSAQLQAALQLERIAEVIELENQALSGRFAIALEAAGDLHDPLVDGDITLREGHYENGLTGTLINDLTLTVRGERQRITLQELSGNDGVGGTLSGEGWVSMDGEKDFPFDLGVKLNRMQLANSQDLSANASADIALDGDAAKALLAGNLTINQVNFTLPSKFDGKPSIPEMKVEEIYANGSPEAKKKAPVKPPIDLTLDLTIDFPQDVFVRGHGLESEWMGHLAITGNAAKPKILGQIESKQGRLDLLGYRFRFDKGVIDFDGASPPLPTLDIQTSTMTKDGFKAMILITGAANEPTLKLSSEPPLPEDEVLSHVLFGKDSTSITPVEAVQLANVVSMLAGGGSFDAFNGARDAMGLDTLSLGGDGFSGTSVKAGKYLTDKIYMEMEKGLTQNTTTATVEVELFPEIKLDSEFDQNSNGALGLKWKRDY